MNVIEADKFRWKGQVENPERIAQFRFVKAKRKCEKWRDKNRVLFLLYRFIYEHYKIKYNTDIPAGCKIGKGFKIRHLGGIVFNPNVVIGNNVDCLNGVLLGKIDSGKKAGTPTIGNNVFLGTYSVIVGNVSIGNHVIIAPGAYVNFDVPSNSIVIGNPRSVIYGKNTAEEYIESPVPF